MDKEEKKRLRIKAYNKEYYMCAVAKEARKRWVKANPEKVKRHKENDYKHNRERYIERNAEYSKNNRLVRRAHSRIYFLVKNKRIEKPTVCSLCGKNEDKIQGHHEDYSKPLEVIWVCVKCHRAIHSNTN